MNISIVLKTYARRAKLSDPPIVIAKSASSSSFKVGYCYYLLCSTFYWDHFSLTLKYSGSYLTYLFHISILSLSFSKWAHILSKSCSMINQWEFEYAKVLTSKGLPEIKTEKYVFKVFILSAKSQITHNMCQLLIIMFKESF